MIKSLFKCFFSCFLKGWPTHQSVSTVNPAPTVQNQDLHIAPPALLIPIPIKVPLFAMNVNKTNTQVCLFAYLYLHGAKCFYRLRTIMFHTHANAAFTAKVVTECQVNLLSLGCNVYHVFFLNPCLLFSLI